MHISVLETYNREKMLATNLTHNLVNFDFLNTNCTINSDKYLSPQNIQNKTLESHFEMAFLTTAIGALTTTFFLKLLIDLPSATKSDIFETAATMVPLTGTAPNIIYRSSFNNRQ